MTYYIGNEINNSDILGVGNSRYFYALRRTADGVLYFGKIDQIKDDAYIQINTSGPVNENYEDFEYGVDFFEGQLPEDHTRPYANLYWDQYRWDNKNCFYYVNSEGELVVRINEDYVYPENP